MNFEQVGRDHLRFGADLTAGHCRRCTSDRCRPGEKAVSPVISTTKTEGAMINNRKALKCDRCGKDATLTVHANGPDGAPESFTIKEQCAGVAGRTTFRLALNRCTR